jgi:tetratricopeptide (TPR) repeat protein
MGKQKSTDVTAAAARWVVPLLPGLVLVAAGLWAYSNSFTGEFLFDDSPAILENADIGQLWPQSVAAVLRSRSLGDFSFAVNYALGGLDVRGYHAVNLVVHLLAALALFGLVRRTLLLQPWRPRFERSAAGLALAAALLWLLHPLQTESVTYVVQRSEALMGLFYLLTLYCVLRGATAAATARWWYAAAGACCALGMASKEVMVTAPLLVLLYDRTFLVGSVREALRRRWPLYAGLAASWLLLAAPVATLFLPAEGGGATSAGFGLRGLTAWEYARSQPGVILHYLRLTLWPDRLCLDYGWPVARTAAEILPPAVVVAALVAAMLWGLARRSWLGYCGAWFFLILAPTSSVVPLLDLAFEHRLYLPLAAVAVLAVLGGHAALEAGCGRLGLDKRRRLWLAGGLVAALAVVLGTLTQWRNEDYRDRLTMWADVVRKRPAHARAHNNLGLALISRGRRAEAARQFQEALRADAGYGNAHDNLATVLLQDGAVDAAMAEYRKALACNPGLARAHLNLGTTLTGLGEFGEAADHLRAACRLTPNNPQAHGGLGRALQGLGKWDEAAAAYRQAVALQPANARYRRGLGFVLGRLGRAEEAKREYAESLRLDPGWPQASLRHAWALATDPDPARRNGAAAVQFAAAAAEATGERDPRALDVLGAAYAEAGRFAEAAETARRARTAAGETPRAREIEERLRLYLARQPFHAPAKAD